MVTCIGSLCSTFDAVGSLNCYNIRMCRVVMLYFVRNIWSIWVGRMNDISIHQNGNEHLTPCSIISREIVVELNRHICYCWHVIETHTNINMILLDNLIFNEFRSWSMRFDSINLLHDHRTESMNQLNDMDGKPYRFCILIHLLDSSIQNMKWRLHKYTNGFQFASKILCIFTLFSYNLFRFARSESKFLDLTHSYVS